MTNTLARVNGNGESRIVVPTKRVLPAPRHELAASIVREIDRVLPGLSSRFDRDQFAHALVVAANELEPDKCSAASVLVAAYGCCKLGLPPGKALGLAYFVPFKGICTLVVGYRGFLDLAYANGFLKDIYTNVVYDGEHFEHWVDETGPRLKHEPGENRDVYKDKALKAYGIAQLANGGRHIRVVGLAELQKAYRDTPAWKGEPHEQAMKTVIRRMAKQWRLSPEMAAAVEWDEQAERGEAQSIPSLSGDAPVQTRRRSLIAQEEATNPSDDPLPQPPEDMNIEPSTGTVAGAQVNPEPASADATGANPPSESEAARIQAEEFCQQSDEQLRTWLNTQEGVRPNLVRAAEIVAIVKSWKKTDAEGLRRVVFNLKLAIAKESF